VGAVLAIGLGETSLVASVVVLSPDHLEIPSVGNANTLTARPATTGSIDFIRQAPNRLRLPALRLVRYPQDRFLIAPRAEDFCAISSAYSSHARYLVTIEEGTVLGLLI
jgi:hypothetical protein